MTDETIRVAEIYPDWYLGANNKPTFKVLLTGLEDREERMEARRFRAHEVEERGFISVLYCATVGDLVYYFFSNPRDHSGFGGEKFDIVTVDEEEITLVGPWSSGTYAINEMAEKGIVGFPQCVSVSHTWDPKVIQRGHTFVGGCSITLQALQKWMKEHPGIDWKLHWYRSNGGGYVLGPAYIKAEDACEVCCGLRAYNQRVYEWKTPKQEFIDHMGPAYKSPRQLISRGNDIRPCRYCGGTGEMPDERIEAYEKHAEQQGGSYEMSDQQAGIVFF